jgi:curved DNA-binding protein CbpA
MSTYYAILGVKPSADADEIKHAFKELMFANHPDKTVHLSETERAGRAALATQVNEAWECLRDVQRKREYDVQLLKLEQLERKRRREEEGMAQMAFAQSCSFEMACTPDHMDTLCFSSMTQMARSVHADVPLRGFAQAYQTQREFRQSFTQADFQGYYQFGSQLYERANHGFGSPSSFNTHEQFNAQCQTSQEMYEQFIPQLGPHEYKQCGFQSLESTYDNVDPQQNQPAYIRESPETYQPKYDQFGSPQYQRTCYQADPQSYHPTPALGESQPDNRKPRNPMLSSGYTWQSGSPVLLPTKSDEALKKYLTEHRTPLARSDNTITIDTGGWHFTVTVSPKYFVVGNWQDKAGRHATATMTTVVHLEPNNTWVKPVRSTQDITLAVQKTPSERDIMTINSLYLYSTTSTPNTYKYHALRLTLSSPNTARSIDLPSQLNFSFDISPALQPYIPASAQYVATHYIFSKTPPKHSHRTYTAQDKLPKIPTQCPEFELVQVLGPGQRLEVVREGVEQSSERYQEIWWEGRKWSRLGCSMIRF